MILEELLKATPAQQFTMLKAMSNRDKLLTSNNSIDLWLYMVETNTFYVMFLDGQGNVQTTFHPILSYEETEGGKMDRKRPLSRDSQKRWNDLLHLLSTDPTQPEEGHIDLDYKDRSRRIRSYYKVTKDDSGQILSISGTSEDISKTREHMQMVIESQNAYIRIVNGLKSAYSTIVFINLQDHSFELIEASPLIRELADGLTNAQEFVEQIISNAMLPAYRERFRSLAQLDEIKEMLKTHRYVAFEFQDLNGTYIKMRVHPAEYSSKGELTHIILSTEIIDEERKAMDQLKMRSEHDGLTGLFNRAAGVPRIEDLLKKESGILALFDCDKFKLINDTFGHLVGDKVLIVVAEILQKVFKDQVIFRLGGDEFVCFLTQTFLDSKAEEGLDAQGIFKQLKDELHNVDIPEMCGQCPSASFGLARSSKDNPLPFDELYKTADISLYQCKKYGRINLANL